MLFDIKICLHLPIQKTQKTMENTSINTETIENQLFSILNNAQNIGRIKFLVQQSGKTYCNEKMVGITFKNGVWHWFTLVQYNNDQKQFLQFLETYSSNNGKSKSGIKHMMDVCRSLNKKFNTNLF
jgi:hypothetical protein